VAKIGAVIVGGFFCTLLTTAFAVTAVRQLKSKVATASVVDATVMASAVNASAPITSSSTPKKAFTDELFNFLCLSTAVSAMRTISLATKSGGASLAAAATSSPWTAAFLLSTTLTSFVFGARLPNKFKQLVHPLVTCTALTWTAAALMGTTALRLCFCPFANATTLYSWQIQVGG
jgi:hypothetical protein